MSEHSVALILVTDDPALVTDAARVGVGAVRSARQFAEAPSLSTGAGPRDVLLGHDPVGELAALLVSHPPGELAVGGGVGAVLAGLAAGTHLLLIAQGDRRADVQAAARAAALARLAGRVPMSADEVRARWG